MANNVDDQEVLNEYTIGKQDETNCKNCNQIVKLEYFHHEGYGAGGGTIIEGQIECECGGCKSYCKDNIPGFRDKKIGKCCKCEL